MAGGRADAGYGIRAAAAEYGLDFIPLLTERYYLACRKDLLGEPAVAQFISLLGSAEFGAILAALPGYGWGITGRPFSVEEALPKPHCISKAVPSNSKKARAKRATAL